MQTTIMRHSLRLLLLGVSLLALSSCYNEEYDEATDYADGKVSVALNIQTRAIGNIVSGSHTYEPGTEWEDYVDIPNGDYHIYFFTYDPTDPDDKEKNNILITEFKPTDIYSTDTDAYTTYTMTSEIEEKLLTSLENFKVVVLANWGSYPTVTVGTTTIDDICNAETAVFDAFVKDGAAVMPSADRLIPFFGLHEYTGVTWRRNTRTTLNGAITLLRAVAKVEVILEPGDNTDLEFDGVSVVNYNSQGYCAPTGVYLKEDYDHDYTWDKDFIDGLHLIGNANDSNQDGRSFAMYETTNSDGYKTWVAYLPEYYNMGDDFSYMHVDFGEGVVENNYNSRIYFANYTLGGTSAYGDGEDENMSDRYDVYRNYLYRYHVTVSGNYELQIEVETWDNVFDNSWSFGITDPLAVGETFTSNNIMYEVLTSTVDDPNGTLTVRTTQGSTFTSTVEIPSTVRHNGFTYTVTQIGSYTFNGQEGIASISVPETIESIGSYAFQYCTGLTSLTVLSYTPPVCGDSLFFGVTTSNITLYVHNSVLSSYQESTTWSGFGFKAMTGI